MDKETIRKYEVDGLVVEIPIFWYEAGRKYIEQYPDFVGEPVYTPDGRPLTDAVTDACRFGEMREPVAVPDCATCKYYRPAAEGTLFGVCDCEYRRKKIPDEEVK